MTLTPSTGPRARRGITLFDISRRAVNTQQTSLFRTEGMFAAGSFETCAFVVTLIGCSTYDGPPGILNVRIVVEELIGDGHSEQTFGSLLETAHQPADTA